MSCYWLHLSQWSRTCCSNWWSYEWRTVHLMWTCLSGPVSHANDTKQTASAGLHTWTQRVSLSQPPKSRHLNIIEAVCEKLFKLDGGSFEAFSWSLADIPGRSLSNPLMSLLPRNILESHWESLQSLTWKLILECHWLSLVSRLLLIMIASSVEPWSAFEVWHFCFSDKFVLNVGQRHWGVQRMVFDNPS